MQKKYIGNIVTNYSKDKFPPFFNVIKKYSERMDGIPTLIIGLETAKENIEDFSILEKQYDNDIWWTYKKTERRYEFDTDIESYYRICFNKFLSKVTYFYLDLPRYTYSGIKKIHNWINTKKEKLCFQTRDSNFIFVYDIEKNIVFGLSMTLCEYIGVDRKKVLNLLKTNKYNRFVYDTTFIDGEIRGIIGNNTHYILPLTSVLR